MKPSFRSQWIRYLLIGLLSLSVSVAKAHNSSKGLSAIKFQIFPDHVKASLAVSFPDIDAVLKFDKNQDDLVTKEEIDVVLGELKEMVRQGITVSFDKHVMTPAEVSSLRQESNFEITLTYKDVPAPLLQYRTALLARLSSAHQEYVTIADEKDATVAEYVLTAADNQMEFSWPGAQKRWNPASASQATTTAAQSMTLGRTFVNFLLKGAEHIIFTANETTTDNGAIKVSYSITDHLLFLLALLVMCHSFMDVFKIVTSFTIAHSITLGLAALDFINMAPRIVEPLIAATIIYVGLENIFKFKTLRWRWIVTFTFGLIHGFGFATAFKEMFGTSGNVLVRLLSFNLGVELGQILIAAVLLPIIWQLRKIPKLAPIWVPVTSALIVAVGVWWLIERLRTAV